MIPILIWFIFIFFIALLACLAIKFLVLRVALAGILILPIIISAAFFVLQQSPVTDSNKDEFFNSLNIISERGESGDSKIPNTIAAFKEAKALGADTIKMDVRMTKDGMLIVFQNDSISESENLTSYEISDIHWVQISEIKISEKSEQTILTFDDAVSWCKKNDMNMMWYIPKFDSDLLTYMRNKVMQDGLYSNVAITTFSFLTALKTRYADDKLIIGYEWRSDETSIVNGVEVGNEYTKWFYSMIDSFGYWSTRSLLIPQFLGIDFMITDVKDADRAMIDESQTNDIHTVIANMTNQYEKSYFSKKLKLPYISDNLELLLKKKTNSSD